MYNLKINFTIHVSNNIDVILEVDMLYNLSNLIKFDFRQILYVTCFGKDGVVNCMPA
jgi:hypothetical protein